VSNLTSSALKSVISRIGVFVCRFGYPPSRSANAPLQALGEKIMKKLQFAVIMALYLSSQAFAQSAPLHRHHRHAPAPISGQYSAIVPSAPAAPGIIRNANDCAPDRAEAVWGAGSALLGYSCVTPSAN
jgi:hypothetical protein